MGLLLSPSAMGVTAINNIVTSPFGGGSRLFSAFVLFAASALAAYSFRFEPPDARALLLLMLQAFLMALACSGVITAILTGQYADGEPRAWQFIAADQWHVIAIVIVYTWLLINLFARGGPNVDS